jgi:hypothetical protein
MDWFRIKEQKGKNGTILVKPRFLVKPSKDIMIRGKSFYALWNGEKWTTDPFAPKTIVDKALYEHVEKRKATSDDKFSVMSMEEYDSKSWNEFLSFLDKMPDNFVPLDGCIVFQGDRPKRSLYSSKRLPYDMVEGDISSYEELISTLFDSDEREKLEWMLGSILEGDSVRLEKFIVLYGEGGTGKSTFLNIVEKLLSVYVSHFEAKALVNGRDAFSTELFKNNPLVAIQHDGDLSRIADNTLLNSIIAHEHVTIREKFKPSYSMKLKTCVMMGTNKPVMITDSHSGLIRRLIDVEPSGRRVPAKRYFTLMNKLTFELGAIAHHCHQVYLERGFHYYDEYKPVGMMYRTDPFYNFIEENSLLFIKEEEITLKKAYELYKAYIDSASIKHSLPKHVFKSEMRAYFREFHLRGRDIEGRPAYNLYKGFRKDRFDSKRKTESTKKENVDPDPIKLKECVSSIFDVQYGGCLAQYATRSGTPSKKWDRCTTTLSGLDSSKLHYVKPPADHIVIDFDIKDRSGNKSLKKNFEAASRWPQTYTEVSKSGNGVHLHYRYDGDVSELSRIYSEGVEIKVFVGNASLRRKLTLCNDLPIATISTGLPKGEKRVINKGAVKNERALRRLLERNLRKEIHGATKPSIDFIHKLLEDAYSNEELTYDVSDLRNSILHFAMGSTNQAEYCVSLVSSMKFKSKTDSEMVVTPEPYGDIVFFDVEVFPNLFIVVWKKRGKDNLPVRMINPTSQEIEALFSMRLVGFNNRRYDNHILYACYLGMTPEQLFIKSQKIINSRGFSEMYGEAYNLSYTDVYDFSTKKQGLKKFEVELGLPHKEWEHSWDEPVPEDKVQEAVEYCVADVYATEAVFEARHNDFIAREVLAQLSGLTPNHTTQQHTARIIFGKDPRPQTKFIYTDLSTIFPDYSFVASRKPKSLYRGLEPSEGGYVYSEPGVWHNVAVLDVASMHPTSLIEMNMFGDEYTKNYAELKEARVAIKHGQFKKARKLLRGLLKPFLEEELTAIALNYPLKIALNIVYGLTSAKFDNKFKDPRNVDNIVAKRGSLFMIDLQLAVQEKGFDVVHIKTDSIKIANATPEVISFVFEFGKKYGYEFEHEETYRSMALVNDAVYIAQKSNGKWTATGAQFAHPYVFKSLFSKEPIEFEDLCEIKAVTTKMYLDFDEGLKEGDHNYKFVGKVGKFVPVKPGTGGGKLYRFKDNKYYSVTGTKNYRWRQAQDIVENNLEGQVDQGYYRHLVDQAVKDINKHGDFESLNT